MKSVNQEIISQSAEETQAAAEILAQEILKERKKGRGALVVGLAGDLGSGKTTFIQGLAKGLAIKEQVNSPSFVLIKKYLIKKPASRFLNFYHIDCYRLDSQKDLLDLGFKEIISQPENLVAIEWADKVRKILPVGRIDLKFEMLGEGERKIIIRIPDLE